MAVHGNLINGEWVTGADVNRDVNPSNLQEVVGAYDDAEATYRRILGGLPLVRAWRGLASVHRVRGRYADAMRILDEAFADERLMGQKLSPPLDSRSATGAPMRAPGRLGGAPAIVVARPTLYRSLVIAASIPLDAALEDWRATRRDIQRVAFAFVVLLLAAGAFIREQMSRLARARGEILLAKATLEQALGAMGDGFLLCDANDRVLAWNRRYLEIFPWVRDLIAPGVPFRELAEAVAPAMVPDGNEADRAAWVERRMAIHTSGNGMYEQELAHGMVIHAIERRSNQGLSQNPIREEVRIGDPDALLSTCAEHLQEA